jgi:hypothetical protein
MIFRKKIENESKSLVDDITRGGEGGEDVDAQRHTAPLDDFTFIWRMIEGEILREQQVREERGDRREERGERREERERDTGREVLPQETSIPT